MDTQKTFECLLATMKTNQEDILARLEAKKDTTLTAMKEEMQARIHPIQSELGTKISRRIISVRN
jgi:hypothetical protein